MVPYNQNETFIEFLDLLDQKRSVLSYTEGSEVPELLSLLSEKIESRESLPVIRVCWNENDLPEKDGSANTTSFHLFKNFTLTMIRIEKLLSARKHLVILSELCTLEQLKNNRPHIRFLSVLLQKCEEYQSTVVTTMNEEYTGRSVRTNLVPLFDNLFTLKKDKRIMDEKYGSIDIIYTIDGDELIIEPYMQSDMNKIKEIFSLTTEEKKELDKIVGQSLEEYRTSM